MVFENEEHRNENFIHLLDILSYSCFLDFEKKCDFKLEYTQVSFSKFSIYDNFAIRKFLDGFAIK